MARTGEGRGPYLPLRTNSHNKAQVTPERAKKKRLAQNSGSVGPERKKKNGNVPAKISYRDQGEIMRQIFGSKSIQPRKLSNAYGSKLQSKMQLK